MFTSLFIVTMMNPNRRLHRIITRPLCKLFDRSTAINTSGISISHSTLLRYDKQSCQTRPPSLQPNQLRGQRYNNHNDHPDHKFSRCVAALITPSQRQQSINIRRIYHYRNYYDTIKTHAKHFSDNKTKSSFELQPHGTSMQMQ
jgi:hypothetical protein